MENEYVKFAGEPDEGKLSSPVRRGVVGKVPRIRKVHGNSLAAYPTPTEFDGQDLLFGLVVGFEIELGYWSLSELEAARGPWGLPIERDLWFEPTPLSQLPDYPRWIGAEVQEAAL
jgi:hypothetical protein